MSRRDLIAAAIGALVTTVLASGIAWAAGGIPGSDGTIQGCYDSGGNLKVVAALPCPKNYTPLPWNQQGVKGDKGEKGDPCLSSDPACVGPKGDKGDPGAPKTISVYRVGNSTGVECCFFGQGTPLTVHCNFGDTAVGGGFDRDDVDVKVSRPLFDNTGWYVVADGGASGGTLDAYVECLHVASG
jgi:hypothetical protein